MKNEKLLMTPGPTNIPTRVLESMNTAMLHHRTKEFGELFGSFNKKLKMIFQTSGSVLTFPAAGTGGLEATIVNCFSPQDKVLGISIGVFGDRFMEIGKTFGVDIDVIKVESGEGIEIEEIKNKFKDEYKALIVTHNETSTGATNHIDKIGEFMKDKSQLYIVDAVSSLGGLEIKMDEWNIDILISASQKALMSPPGLTFVGVSEKAWDYIEKSKMPKYYWNFKNAKKDMEKAIPENPYTPAVSLIVGTNEALDMILEEGLDNVFDRHKRLGELFRNEVKKLNLELFVKERYISNTITSIKIENDLAPKIKKMMEEEFNIIIAAGQEELKTKIIRVGHMGYVNEEMIYKTSDALKKTLEIIM